MTTQRPKWLITIPDNSPMSFSEALTAACGGKDKLGTLLYFFLGRGAYVVAHTNQDPNKIEFVRLTLSLDQIVAGLKDLQKGASKASIILWIGQLNGLGYVISNGYQQQYDIYFHKIAEGITNPPPKNVTPRGRHASKIKIQDSTLEQDSQTQNQDSRFNLGESTSTQDSSVEIQDLTLDYKSNPQVQALILESTQDLTLKIQDLTLEISEVKSKISDFESQISDLKSLISSERASREALEAKFDAINNIYINNNNILKSKNASASDDQTDTPKPSRRNSKKKPPEEATQPTLPQGSEKQDPVLSERGQVVFDEWCKQPWFKRARPNLTETAIGHCNALAESCDPLPTAEEMAKVRSWYQKKNAWCQGWHLGNLKDAYPQWLSENYKPTDQPTLSTAPAMQTQMVESEAQSLAARAMAMGKGHDHEIQALVDGNKVIVQWNTLGFNKPQIFTSEIAFLDAFQEMVKLWDVSKKKLSRKAI